MSHITKKMPDYLERQKRLCEEYNVDFEKVKEINSRLTLLLQKVVKKESLNKLCEVHVNMDRNIDYWLEIWNVFTSPAANLEPKQKSLLELFLYLVLSEGIFSEIIQAISFILIENHHDIYDPQHMKFVENYEGLDRVTLYIKLQFIKKHGLEFIADAVDRKLRNCIAHLKFVVNDDGSILDTRTGKLTKDLRKKTDYLGCICAVIMHLIGDWLIRKASQIQ